LKATLMPNNVPDGLADRQQTRLTFHTITLATFYAASSVPMPLYRVYHDFFGFSPELITVIFAVYCFSLLSLLVFGSISDHLGRRPVIFASLLMLAVSVALFLLARSPAWLIAARAVQGFATGVAASAIGAALIDIDPLRGSVANSIAPLTGMAIGAVVTSLLVQFAPYPMDLVYVFLLSLSLRRLVCGGSSRRRSAAGACLLR
jgi:MFS family permease